jgi:hypothetical protein
MISRITIACVLSSLSLFASAQKKQSGEYVIVARFISYGAGVPNNKPVMNFVHSFEKKYKTKKINVDTIGPRGREGEYGLGFYLHELSDKQKKSFVQQIKKITKQHGDRGEIQYEENVSAADANIPGRGNTQTIKIE